MGVCQTNIPCSQIVKAKIETQTFINDSIKKELPIKENKSLITEDARVCNEGIKIALPARSFSSTKISSRNLTKMKKEQDIIKENKIRERKVEEIKNRYFPIDRVETKENDINNNYQNENYYSDDDYNNNSIDELFDKKLTIINQKEKY